MRSQHVQTVAPAWQPWLLLALLAACCAMHTGGNAPSPELELQGSTVGPHGGGSVWVLTSGDPAALNATSAVHVVDAGGSTVASARVESVSPDGGLLLIAIPGGLPAAAYRLAFGGLYTPAVNAPEPHWCTPRARVGDELAIYGRRFRREAGTTVILTPAAGGAPTTVAAYVENENRATFVLPNKLTAGRWLLAYHDSWGIWTAEPPITVEVLSPLPPNRVANASLPPYSADATGATDAAPAISAAIRDAGSGGTVVLGAGVFLLARNTNSTDRNCRTMAAAVCLSPITAGTLPVTVAGLGEGLTSLRQGPTAQNAFWGSAVSLANLTLTDELPVGQSPSVPAGSYTSAALFSMDTYGAWAHNFTDLAFTNVHFISSRNKSHALMLRYIRGVRIRSCRFDYASIALSGPLLDVQMTNCSARLQSQTATGFIQNGVGGRISSVVIANTTVTGLVPQEESTIAGRFHQAQGYWEHLYVAGNVNERASPGDLHHDSNQGEQFCWESGDMQLDAKVKVERVGATADKEGGLGITADGTGFTLDGKATFLKGISYFGYGSGPDAVGLAVDLDAMQNMGVNWLRLWVTWREYSMLTRDGSLIGSAAERLVHVLDLLDTRGMVADLTMNREADDTKARLCAGSAGLCGGLADQAAHLRGLRALANLTLPFRRVYFDLANEHNVGDSRYVNHTEIRALRDAVKGIDPQRLVTASCDGHLSMEERLDFVSAHLPRGEGCAAKTNSLSRSIIAAMPTRVPLHLQEPFRRDYSPSWNPSAEEFFEDLAGARAAGAAGWCFHNGDNIHAEDGRPHRSFNMSTQEGRLLAQWDSVERQVVQNWTSETERNVGGATSSEPWPTITVDALPTNTANALTLMLGADTTFSSPWGMSAGKGQTWDRRYGLGTGGVSRRRDCHFAGVPSTSLLKRLPKAEGVQQNYSLADG